MAEFKDTVRRYGVIDRRNVQFVANDMRRCQVCRGKKCPFYIWCSGDKNIFTIRALVHKNLYTKPYNKIMANVKYLCEIFGTKLRNIYCVCVRWWWKL